ncbi:MAG: hypothetical protein E2O52_07670 [Gammaproteobacteria bacterium]|nr:MAG: hypothetical protein E2O52_07670 [Gammaproteobacteria bacterium]
MLLVVMTLAACTMSRVDPYEGVNREFHGFNDKADQLVLKPIAKGYTVVTPGPVGRSVHRFFANLRGPTVFINLCFLKSPAGPYRGDAFRGEIEQALDGIDGGRRGLNSDRKTDLLVIFTQDRINGTYGNGATLIQHDCSDIIGKTFRRALGRCFEISVKVIDYERITDAQFESDDSQQRQEEIPDHVDNKGVIEAMTFSGHAGSPLVVTGRKFKAGRGEESR